MEYEIYLYKNKINNKLYIGQTKLGEARAGKDGINYKKCGDFYKAILDYG